MHYYKMFSETEEREIERGEEARHMRNELILHKDSVCRSLATVFGQFLLRNNARNTISDSL